MFCVIDLENQNDLCVQKDKCKGCMVIAICHITSLASPEAIHTHPTAADISRQQQQTSWRCLQLCRSSKQCVNYSWNRILSAAQFWPMQHTPPSNKNSSSSSSSSTLPASTTVAEMDALLPHMRNIMTWMRHITVFWPGDILAAAVVGRLVHQVVCLLQYYVWCVARLNQVCA